MLDDRQLLVVGQHGKLVDLLRHGDDPPSKIVLTVREAIAKLQMSACETTFTAL
jgi:hypothetical protein